MKSVIVSFLITIAVISLIVEADKTQSEKQLLRDHNDDHNEEIDKRFFDEMMRNMMERHQDEDDEDEVPEKDSWDSKHDDMESDDEPVKAHQAKTKVSSKKNSKLDTPLRKELHKIIQKIKKEKLHGDIHEEDPAREVTENRNRDIETDETVAKAHQSKAEKSSKKTIKVEKPVKKEHHEKNIKKTSKNQKSAAAKQLNDKVCGKSVVSEHLTRIVGGQEATPHSLPWQAALVIERTHYDGRVTKHAYCGASIISREWIATAAHCAKDKYPTEDIRVWLGSHNLKKKEKSRIVGHIVKKIQHPSYNAATTDYDIALLKLEKPVEFNNYVRPICLPDANKRAMEGVSSLISGWGTLSFRGSVSPTLQVAVVPIVSRDRCNGARSYHGEITSRMLCAGYQEGGVDTCQGDSGGPLSTQIKNADKFELTGIVSWGAGCARSFKYGVYSDVSFFRDWIDKTINENSQ